MTAPVHQGADRTQFLIMALSLLVMGLAVAAENLVIVDRAVEELENLDRLDYADLASFAEQTYDPSSFLRHELQRHQGIQLSPNFRTRGAVIRTWPVPSSPLRDYASFIEGDPRVKVFFPTTSVAEAIGEAKQHPNPEGHALVLDSVILRCYSQRDDGREDDVWGTDQLPPIVDPLRSTCRSLEWNWSLGTGGVSSNKLIDPPVAIADCCSSARFGDPTAVRRWLATLGPPYSDLYNTDRESALPRLRVLWAELGALTIKEAAQYLRQRQDGSPALKLQGITLTTSAAVLAPYVTATLILLLTIQLAGLRRFTGSAVPLAARQGLDAHVFNVATLLALPAGANLLLLYRVAWSGPQRWIGLVGCIFLTIAQGRLAYALWVCYCDIRRERRWRVV